MQTVERQPTGLGGYRRIGNPSVLAPYAPPKRLLFWDDPDLRAEAVTKSLVLTVIGSDRPGIVNLLSDVAQRFGANWVGSRMASLAGQFAGIVHFEVPDQNVETISSALRELISSGLHVVIAMGDSRGCQPGNGSSDSNS